MFQKDMGSSAKGSYEGRPQPQFGGEEHVDEHVELIVTPPMDRHINV